jgi:hypothetical protein
VPQPLRSRLTVAAGAALVLVLLTVAGVAGLRWWQDRNRTDLERAMGWAPEGSLRFSWTDWAGVRRELGSDVDASSSTGDVEELLSRGFDADLTSTSSMVDSAATLHEEFGFSPAVVDWELLSQGDDGSVATMGLPDSVSLSALGDRFEDVGYTRPGDPDGVWEGGEELLATLGGVSPQFAYLALDEERGLLLASDSEAYLGEALTALDDSSIDDEGLDQVTDAVGEPVTAALYTGDQACRALAMSQADPADQEAADELIASAGDLNPMTGFAIAGEPDGDVLVAMSFENDDQARINADSRAVLASGPAPGQGGEFADRFELGDVTADGSLVTMELHPTRGSYVLSDLSTGPVLFATC